MTSQLKNDTTNDTIRDSLSDEKARIEEILDVGPDLAIDCEDTEEEKALVRKIDGRILPVICLVYLFACELSFIIITQHFH